MTSIGSLSFFVKTPNERLPIALQSGRTTCQRRFGSAYGFGVSCRENDVDRNVRSWIWKKMVVEGGCSVRFGSSSRVVSVMAVGKRGVSETEVDGANNDGDNFGVDVDDDLIKTTVEKSEKVQSLQNDLLQQIAERRKLISSIKESILDTATDAVASGGDNSFLSDYGIALINENSDKENKNKKSKNYSTTVTTEKPETTNDMNGSLIGVEKEFLDDTKIENLVANALGLSREKDFVETDAVTIPSLLPNFAEIDAAKDVKHEEPEEENKVLTVEEEADSEKGKTNTPLAGLNVMNVILVAAECAPWSKTGGLGDVAGALPKALARRGHRVMVVVPQYRNYSETQETGVRKIYNVDGQDMEVTYHHAFIDGVDFVFMDSAVFRGLHDIYGGQRMDIFKRMALLCKAAVEVPWLVPCGGTCYGDGNLVFIANDWHTALLPVYLKAYYRDNGLMKFARSVLVIHNIAYQGRGPLDDFKYLALPPHHFDLFKFYDPVGGEHLNIFAAGIKAADRVVAVSHGYSWELKTLEGGWGLHHIINDNDWKLHGIVNGIDTEDWNPEVDVHLKSDGYTNYSLKTLKTGKAQCKVALQREFSLPVRDVPLAGFIGRLDGQKGVDIIAEAIPWLVSQDAQLILLGTGRNDLEDLLRKFEGLYHDKVIGRVGFSVRWAHRITAGADILLMPSRFEPCGLNQLYAMSYGTVPVVHAVGGLRDTVKPFNPFTNEGVGWTFDRADANALIDAMKNCFDTYWNYKSSWEDLQVRGMTQDLGWDNVAERYEEVLVAAKYQW